MNDLENYFKNNTGKLIHKWQHYFEIYDRHFSAYRGKEVHIVEFGIFQGGSLQMWKDYFGPKAKIYGVDINPHCKKLEEEQVQVFIGDQEDRSFLRSLANKIPKIDILIEDGGHTMKQQIHTFEELYPHVAEDGVYLCEDTHTSYWKGFGGGYKRRGSFIEYSKNWIDDIHAWHSRQPSKLKVSEFTRSAHSLHFYDSVVVIEKRKMEKPYDLKTGTPSIPIYSPPKLGLFRKLEKRLRTKRKNA
ncbi:MAG: class I SAM-dependent methyltransferase [Gammaproteobacteria bacterium]|nr:class I SAM-dependent methyltransferase [Gammaproteobacteria bacterium]